MDSFPAAGLTETSSLKLWPWQERKKGLKKEKKNEGEHLTDVETGLEAKATALKSCYGSKKVEKKNPQMKQVLVIVKSRSHTTLTYQHFYIPNICWKYWQKKKGHEMCACWNRSILSTARRRNHQRKLVLDSAVLQSVIKGSEGFHGFKLSHWKWWNWWLSACSPAYMYPYVFKQVLKQHIVAALSL